MTPRQAFSSYFASLQSPAAGTVIGVAVSGGSDSMALLLLAKEFADQFGLIIKAATVDHGLRPEAATEATEVAAFCKAREIAHTTLRWSEWEGRGNLQSAARTARYALLTAWAQSEQIDTVLLGHTKDDQAETVLMALARGSGVDGLAGMPDQKDGLFMRPLLNVGRSALRELLVEMDLAWIDDPSNADDRYDRVKARQMMMHLAELGLTTDRLIQTARHMGRARNTLAMQAKIFTQDHVKCEGPDITFPLNALDFETTDTGPRIFASAIMWISGTAYRPRFQALCDAAQGALNGETRTLQGVKIIPEKDGVRLIREVGACRDVVQSEGGESELIWDKRWRIALASGAWPPNLTIRALGDAISNVKNWRDSGLLHASAMATPGIFDGDILISAPAIGFNEGFSARFVADFHSSAVIH